MTKRLLFFLTCGFLCGFLTACAQEPVLTKEAWLKKFAEARIEEQCVILSSIHYVHFVLGFIHENKEIIKKAKKFNVDDEELTITKEQQERLQQGSSSVENGGPKITNKTVEDHMKALEKLIFGDTATGDFSSNMFKNIDQTESMKKKAAEIFNSARSLFLKKLDEDLVIK